MAFNIPVLQYRSQREEMFGARICTAVQNAFEFPMPMTIWRTRLSTLLFTSFFVLFQGIQDDQVEEEVGDTEPGDVAYDEEDRPGVGGREAYEIFRPGFPSGNEVSSSYDGGSNESFLTVIAETFKTRGWR